MMIILYGYSYVLCSCFVEVGDYPQRWDGLYCLGFLFVMGVVNVVGYFVWKVKCHGHEQVASGSF